MAGKRADNSGRYQGVNGDWRLELRLDMEGATALDLISGELWRGQQRVAGFLLHGPELAAQLPGGGRLVVRLSTGLPSAELTTEAGLILAFPCRHVSRFFREVAIQPAVQRDLAHHWFVIGFRLLPFLSEIYARAGIGLYWKTPRVVAKASDWSESRLRETLAPLGHALLFADRHGEAANVRGLRVESGCAVFLQTIGDRSEAAQRHGLFTCVHEIGHTLGLPHALPAECSWMSVPARYPGGEELFFTHFEEKFLYQELRYLRHGTRLPCPLV